MSSHTVFQYVLGATPAAVQREFNRQVGSTMKQLHLTGTNITVLPRPLSPGNPQQPE